MTVLLGLAMSKNQNPEKPSILTTMLFKDAKVFISGVKRNGQYRHWAGSGKVIIDRKCIDEYLSVISMPSLPDHNFIIEDIEDSFPVDRINKLLNEK